MILRDDVARAARAAVWARAAGLLDGYWRPEWRDEMLRNTAAFLAHLRAGTVEVRRKVPEETVHPWDCVLDNDYSYIYLRCPNFSVHARGAVPAEAVEAALAGLRRARTAGTVVWDDALVARPAPPHYADTARGAVRAARAALDGLDLAGALHVDGPDAVRAAATPAAIEAGNWVAELYGHPARGALRGGSVRIEVYRWFAGVVIRDADGEVNVRVHAARAPRSMRPAFAAAYARWYRRVAGALVERQLEAVGV